MPDHRFDPTPFFGDALVGRFWRVPAPFPICARDAGRQAGAPQWKQWRLFGEGRMFSTWMIGFLVVMATLVWVAVVAGLPQPSIGLAVGALLVVAVGGALGAIRRVRRQRPWGR